MRTGLRLAYGPGMTRMSALWLALLPALPLLLPVPIASAQLAGSSGTSTTTTGGVNWLLTAVGSTKYVDTSYKVPINKSDCDSNALLHLSLTAIPTGAKYLEVWVGDSCQNGDRTTRISPEHCVYVDYKEQDTTNTADTDFTIAVEKACMLGDGARTFYILPVNTLMGTTNVSPFAQVTLNFDKTPPSPPTSVKGGAGQTEIPVSWTQPSDTYYFWVVVDTNAAAGGGDTDSGSPTSGDCASTLLQSGTDFDPNADPLPDGIWVKYINEKASRATLSADDLGVTTGRAAVAVMAEDLGHNRSQLSNLACIDIVPTTGFWDTYRKGGGTADEGCVCTAPGGTRPRAQLAWPLLLGLAAVALWRRTRRRA